MKGPITLIRNAVDVFLQNPKLFVGIYIIPGILTFLVTMLVEFQEGLALATPVTYTLAAILWILVIIASIFMGIAMIHAVMNPSLSIMDAYRASTPYFWRYVILSIVVTLAVLAGFLLLIIPGIIFSVWFAFSYYVLIAEGTGGIEAMKQSKRMVSGKWWAVFGRLLVLVAIGIVVGLIFGLIGALFDEFIGAGVAAVSNLILNAILTPISIAYVYVLYLELKQVPQADVASVPDAPQAGEAYTA
ncbi:MAG: YciC family protein [Candidatus Paceibacterota bacterium]